MIKADTTTLSNIINQCFAYSSDGRLSPTQQAAMLADGKRLRGLLLNLLSAQFNDGTQAVLDANNQLTKVNTALAASATALANAVQILNDIASLVGSLDKLLNVVAGVV
jgi:geranylgeranyl pyrophosphate synthase